MKDVPIIKAAVAYDDSIPSETFIVIISQTLGRSSHSIYFKNEKVIIKLMDVSHSFQSELQMIRKFKNV